jgi:hypothetical protein
MKMGKIFNGMKSLFSMLITMEEEHQVLINLIIEWIYTLFTPSEVGKDNI